MKFHKNSIFCYISTKQLMIFCFKIHVFIHINNFSFLKSFIFASKAKTARTYFVNHSAANSNEQPDNRLIPHFTLEKRSFYILKYRFLYYCIRILSQIKINYWKFPVISQNKQTFFDTLRHINTARRSGKTAINAIVIAFVSIVAWKSATGKNLNYFPKST